MQWIEPSGATVDPSQQFGMTGADAVQLASTVERASQASLPARKRDDRDD